VITTAPDGVSIRPARTADIRAISDLIEPLVVSRVLLGKELVMLFEAVQEFVVAEKDGEVVGCGALHVFWEDLGEVRTLAVADEYKGQGIGSAILRVLEGHASDLGVSQLFCLTFEVDFFSHHGYREVDDQVIDPEVYVELVRSPDEGVAEFLDLARVKPNTLGNARMLKTLSR
jgi:amino-acid N-acetyltransferase